LHIETSASARVDKETGQVVDDGQGPPSADYGVIQLEKLEPGESEIFTLENTG
jgi:hypothetical protein